MMINHGILGYCCTLFSGKKETKQQHLVCLKVSALLSRGGMLDDVTIWFSTSSSI